jgi:predicted nucleic acid-binding protein
MRDRVFVDTNLWIYLYSDDAKQGNIQRVLDRHFQNVYVSTQVLGETYHVLTRKSLKSKEEAKTIIMDLATNFNVLDVLLSTVMKAIDFGILYGYSYWDTLIIATALGGGCTVLFTEDMQNNQVIEKKLKIVNPFEL